MRFIRLCLFVGGVVMAMAWANRPVHAEGFFSKLFGWGSSRRAERTIEPPTYHFGFGGQRFEYGRSYGDYGWPQVEGRGDDPAFVNPVATWTTDEASPSGLAFAGGSLWMGGLRGERLWQIPVGQDGSVGKPVGHYTETYGRLRGVTAAPDGTVWVSTSNKDGRGSPRDGDDRILRFPAS